MKRFNGSATDEPSRVPNHGYSIPGWKEISPPGKVSPGIHGDMADMVMEFD